MKYYPELEHQAEIGYETYDQHLPHFVDINNYDAEVLKELYVILKQLHELDILGYRKFNDYNKEFFKDNIEINSISNFSSEKISDKEYITHLIGNYDRNSDKNNFNYRIFKNMKVPRDKYEELSFPLSIFKNDIIVDSQGNPVNKKILEAIKHNDRFLIIIDENGYQVEFSYHPPIINMYGNRITSFPNAYLPRKYNYINYDEISNNNDLKLSDDGIIKTWYILSNYINSYYNNPDCKNKKDCFYFDIDADGYVVEKIYHAFENKNKIITNIEEIKEYFDTLINISELINIIPMTLIEQIKNIIKKLPSKVEIEIPEYITKFNMPDAWYITKNGYLYNCGYANGHKQTNFQYTLGGYYDNIINRRKTLNFENVSPFDTDTELDLGEPKEFRSEHCFTKEQIKENYEAYLSRGYVTENEYRTIFNYSRNTPLSLELYQNKKEINQNKKYHNFRLVKTIAGYYSAATELDNFFYRLNKESNDYERDIKYLASLNQDELFIRVFGWSKILSFADVHEYKTIVTSLSDWQKEFKEYILNGWHIDYIPGIDIIDGKLQEICKKEDAICQMNEEEYNHYLVKKFHIN